MPRGNQKGGKKHKRGKKNYDETKVLRLKEDGQEYAQITGCKGNCRFDVKCCDGKDRMAVLCGAMRKRKFVNMKDVVLVSIRDFQDDKCSIIHKYADDEVSKLINKNEIPSNFKISSEDSFNEKDDNYFDYSQISSSSESDDENDSEENVKKKVEEKEKEEEEDFFIDVNDI